MPPWGLPALSWLVSFYFLLGFIVEVGFPPKIDVKLGHLLFAALWLFFLFLPFFRKIKIGYLELERELEQTKAELKEFKAEVRNNLAVISTNVNTMGNLSNQVTVNVPVTTDLDEIKRRLDQLAQPQTQKEAQDIRTEIAAIDGEDRIMALARTRIRIEYLLRELLGKRTSIGNTGANQVKLLSLSRLVQLFFEQYPQQRELEEPIRYVLQVCNAAVHAQRLSPGQADEALEIGSRILALLSDIKSEQQ
jgi:hypothetical protein